MNRYEIYFFAITYKVWVNNVLGKAMSQIMNPVG